MIKIAVSHGENIFPKLLSLAHIDPTLDPGRDMNSEVGLDCIMRNIFPNAYLSGTSTRTIAT
jgi:hypothetical protein